MALVITREVAQVTVVAARGPQGPSFAEENFLDSTAINALTSSDIGKILVWNGTKYVPEDHLDAHLTIVGGAF